MSKDTKRPPGKKLGVSSTKVRTLKRGSVEPGVVRQSFTHGRSKAVVVEKVKRPVAGPIEAKAESASSPTVSGVGSRTLTEEERSARTQVLADARLREAEERIRHEMWSVEQRRIADQDKRHLSLKQEYLAHHDEQADNEEAQRRIAKVSNENSNGLNLAGLGALRKIPPLHAGLSNLTGLSLAWTQISDVEPIAPLVKLKYLNLCGTSVRDLRPLINLRELEILILWGTQVDDISPLQSLSPNYAAQLADMAQITDLA